jgi:nucleoside-diphosphate-sugar epimerase
MKILVTGTAGTVGSELVKVLLQRGAQPGYEVEGEPHGGYRHV